MALRHRPEIDGLRAFAILPILLAHCGVTVLVGGHVGVDVFFVISGYLITAIVQREIAEDRFTLAGFYRRRAVRILPALLAMVAAVLAVSSATQFPGPLRDIGRSAAATAAFGSNVYFYATSDYFARASELKPLIHTWSLAVEEQFYLLYPLLLLALRKAGGRAVVAVMITLAALSLAIGGYLAFSDPTAGFYLLPARIWELLLGGLVAVGAYPRLRSTLLRELVCWAALAAIVASAVLVRPNWPFPVPFAIPPAGGAALLIAYAPRTRVASLLSLAPLRWVGLISYSLYLWHRPIIATYLHGRSWETGTADTAILLALSFGTAILSYALIERPALRRWRKGQDHGPLVAGGLALVATVVVGLAIAAAADRLRPLPPPVARVVGFLGFDRTPAGRDQYLTGTCFALPYGKPYDPACLAPTPGRDNVMLVGDSHAGQLSQALRARLAPAHLMQATAAGCRPLLVTQGFGPCREVHLLALERTDLRPVSAVVLAGRWFDADLPGLADTIRALKARGVARVVVVGPVVEYQADFPELLGTAMLTGDVSRLPEQRLEDRPVLDARMRPLVAAAGGIYVSHFEVECPNGDCRLFTPSGDPVHIDQSHLTPEGAAPVAERIARALGR